MNYIARRQIDSSWHEVTPFRTFDELMAVLDRGGAFYNVFTHAEDGILDVAELAAAVPGGVDTGRDYLLAWLALSSSHLTPQEHVQLSAALPTRLAERWTSLGLGVRPLRETVLAEPGRWVLVEGTLTRDTLGQAERMIRITPDVFTQSQFGFLGLSSKVGYEFDVFSLAAADDDPRLLVLTWPGTSESPWLPLDKRILVAATTGALTEERGGDLIPFLRPHFFLHLDAIHRSTDDAAHQHERSAELLREALRHRVS